MKRLTLDPALLILLIWLAFGLRMHQLGEHSLWYDELLELDIAQGSFSDVEPRLERHAAMPLDYYILNGWIRLGRQESWVRFPAVFFGLLTIPLVYVFGKQLFGKRVGYLAATLLAVDFFAVDYSQEARPYALLLFFTILIYLGLWQVCQTDRLRYWGLVLLGLSGAALTHYFTLFMLLPFGLFFAFHQLYYLRQKRFWRHTVCFVFAVLTLIFIFGLYGRLGVLYSVGDRFASVINQPESLTLPRSEKPNRGSGPPMTREFFVDKILSPLATSDPITLGLYTAYFLIAVISLLIVRQQQKAILLLLGWLILPIVLIYTFLLHRGTFYAIRYILYTLPAFLMLVAYGIDRLHMGLTELSTLFLRGGRPGVTRLLISGNWLRHSIVIVALFPLIVAQLDEFVVHHLTDSKEDWRAVGQLLYSEAKPDDAVIAVKAESTINWYFPPATAPFGAFWRSEPVWQAINQHQRRWFILSSYSSRYDRGLRDWLANQQAVKIAIDRRVVVYFHQEGQTVAEMLAQVKDFALPKKALTYAGLAEQFEQSGDLETSRVFYQKAIELTDSAGQKANYEAHLVTLSMSEQPVSQ